LIKVNVERSSCAKQAAARGFTLRTAIFADIHANRQAFEACLKQARERDADSIVLLGDYVGYGADPEWVT